MSLKKRLGICEAVIAGKLTVEEARQRRVEVLRQTRRGRLLLRVERAERSEYGKDGRGSDP
jgi:hypothetical protein